jgi:drug/metabolite transporter (DMT)-like permease
MTLALLTATYALASAFAWGTGDFLGGLTARRIGPLFALFLSYFVGFSSLVLMALVSGEAFSSGVDIFWGALSGLVGLVGYLFLLQGFATGRMSVVAPVSAVLTAVLPVVFTALEVGPPGATRLFGFGLALAAIWLLSSSEDKAQRPAGIGAALLAGLGFGGFFILLDQIGDGAVFWPLAAGRLASIIAMGAYILARKGTRPPAKPPWKLLAPVGVADVAGNYFFLLAVQTGRLDIASVLVSLYPAITVLWATWIAKERLTRWQALGVLLAVAAIALITV